LPINSTVTHIIGFPIDFNGNLRRASSEAVHCARHGVKVNFAVSEDGAQRVFKDTGPTPNVRVVPLKPLISRTVAQQFSWRVNNLFALPLQTFKLALNKTIIHVHAPTPVFKPFSIALINNLSKMPLVLDLHDPWSGHPFPFIGSFETQLRTEIMRYAINKADAVVVAHTALVDAVKNISPNKSVTIIPNGVDIELFHPQTPKASVAKSLGINPTNAVVAFSGHITNEKGLDVLVKAAPEVVREHKNVKFLIVGDGLFMKEIKTMVKQAHLEEQFIFTGFVSGERLPDYLSFSQICVAPYTPGPWYEVSKVETPIKVVEYMAMGKSVIMSRISQENVLTWADGGELTTPGSISELAASINKLLDDEKLRNEYGRRGRKFVENGFSWQKITEKLVTIYQTLDKRK
jgi:glycosyltransferase involved in cell wall biosynthesis